MLLLAPAWAAPSAPPPEPSARARQFSTSVVLHGKPLELHLTAPSTPVAPQAIVLYASGDGGWFGTAVDMFKQIGDAGYFAVGFSSRAFLKSSALTARSRARRS